MRRTLKIRMLLVAVSKTAAATLAITLIVSCLLPYATSANFGESGNSDSGASGAGLESTAAIPIKFLTFSRELKFGMGQPNLGFYGMGLPEMVAPLPLIDVTGRVNKFDMSDTPSRKASIAPLPHKPDGHQDDSIKRIPKRAAFHVVPRHLGTNVDRVSFDTPSLAPMSFVRFCMKYPGDCAVHKMAFRPRPVELTKARLAELSTVNRDVNRAITPQANQNGVIAEEWRISPREGDCKDYAVTKRHDLLARGWPSRSLLLAEVVVASGEHHLVLVVRTSEDDLVLDNLNWNVRPISTSQYRWVRAQQPGNPKFWSMIRVAHGNRVAMNAR